MPAQCGVARKGRTQRLSVELRSYADKHDVRGIMLQLTLHYVYGNHCTRGLSSINIKHGFFNKGSDGPLDPAWPFLPVWPFLLGLPLI